MTTKFRGATIAPYCKVDNLNALVAKGANLFRYPIYVENQYNFEVEVQKHIDHIKSLCRCDDNRRFVLTLYTRPFADSVLKATWIHIALEFKSEPLIFGYDFLQEPLGSHGDNNKLMSDLAEIVSSIDHNKLCIVSSRAGTPAGIRNVKPIKGDYRLMYTVHAFDPLSFTHQGIGKYPLHAKYPNVQCNKKTLETYLRPVRKFQLMNRCHIYVGEFDVSVHSDLEHYEPFLADYISLFEEYGWQWTFGTVRDGPGWCGLALPGFYVPEAVGSAWSRNKE